MNIAEILLRRAAELGDVAAIVDVHERCERSFSFRRFEAITAAVAGQLRSFGLGHGDGVLLLHPVAAELYFVLVALFRLGCVAIFLDPSAGREHVAQCCAIFPPKAFFGSKKAQLMRWSVPALRHIPKAFCAGFFPGAQKLEFDETAKLFREIAPVKPDAPALLTFTSGSTGRPKAALRTHGFLLAQYRALGESLQLPPGTHDLTTLPIFVLANLGSGVTSVLPDADLRSPGKIVPGPVLQQIERQRIQTTAASPAFISRLLDECERRGATIRSIETVFMGGAPVFPGLLRRAKASCPQAKIVAVYGSTEAEPMAEISLSDIAPEDFAAMEQGHGLLAGRPVASISLRVMRENWGVPIAPLDAQAFQELTAKTGEAGEIVVAGDHVLPGYLGGEGNAETKFTVDGRPWHRTGDAGYLDEVGRLWLLGRCAGKIQDERGTLYPFAVECAAMQTASIRRAALAAVGKRRVLAVEARGPISTDAILSSLSWAHLDEVVQVEYVPVDKRHNAKVDYVALAEKLRTVRQAR
jgi:olefin beta-lactone synthetase